jgi:multidrug efflux system outer membrane protein
MRKLLPLSLLLSMTGCALVGPDYVEPEPVVTLNDAFVQAEIEQENTLYRSVEPEVEWWKSLNDATLDKLIELALNNNTDLRIAIANLSSARAVLVESETGLQPQIDFEGRIDAQRMAGYQRGSNDEAAEDNLVTSVGIGLGWELDLFGRVQRSVEAASRNIEAEQALLADMQRIIISDVASAYIDYRGALQQKSVVTKNITNQTETLDITQAMEREGLSTGLDISRAQAQLMSTHALLPAVNTDLVVAQNRLATLTAQTSANISQLLSNDNGLPTLPQFIAVGNPESLIRRRPDIKAAERSLASLTAKVGVSTAELFPIVSLNGAIGLGADQPSDISASGAPNYSIGPALTWNLFNRDAIRARIKQAEARVDAQLARYDQTVLNALEEVNTSLVQHYYERERNQALRDSVAASLQAVDLVRNRYNAGAESFLGVLDAERTLLASEQQLTDSDIALNQSLIMIYRALSGGWQTEN